MEVRTSIRPQPASAWTGTDAAKSSSSSWLRTWPPCHWPNTTDVGAAVSTMTAAASLGFVDVVGQVDEPPAAHGQCASRAAVRRQHAGRDRLAVEAERDSDQRPDRHLRQLADTGHLTDVLIGAGSDLQEHGGGQQPGGRLAPQVEGRGGGLGIGPRLQPTDDGPRLQQLRVARRS